MADRGLVLVTGATGAIGPCVVGELLRQGYGVRSVSLTPPARPLPPEVEVRVGDITDLLTAASVVEGTAAVIHMAARLHLAGPPSRDVDAYQRVNVDGTATVVAAARNARVPRVILTSTIAVYGPSRAEPATEQSAVNPETPYARTKLLAEDVVRRCLTPGGEPMGTVVRLAAVYGPSVKGNYRVLVDLLAAKRFVPVGSGRNRRTLIHERDVGRALVHVLEAPTAAGKTYNVTDGAVHTTDEIVHAICAALGRPVPRWHVPRSSAFALARIGDRLTGFARGDRISLLERLQRYTEDVAVDGSAFQRDLHFSPMYSLEEGWKQAIDEMRTGPALARL